MKQTEGIELAITTLKNGKPIILCDDESREGEGDLAFAAKYSTPELVNLMLTIGRGLLCVAMKETHAKKLGIKRLTANNQDLYDTPFGVPISLADNSSGISVTARSNTLVATSDNESSELTFTKPGHVATLIAHPEGLKRRQGHTEAIVDLLHIADIDSPGVLCEILTKEGEIAKEMEIKSLSEQYNIPILNVYEIENYLSVKKEKVCI